ncbi:hypothetical protein I633_02115 [Alteromonas mediterranea 615]|uniref:Uncharacterized protein n=1 Tax=Alteromonas mediterranea 615 TaxID=1300253 RepID=S5A8R6_9ALTE|nr:hypothetical protein I633_02115 [Alteromonas mediterranea 615]
MTTITPAFSAPERYIQHHTVAKKTAWRPLLISGLVHVIGVILVVILSQLSIDTQKKRATMSKQMAEINAKLYYPPAPQQKENTKAKPQKAPVDIKPTNTPATPIPTLSQDANRRAGSLNLSVKDGSALYFEKYHRDKVAEDAEQAASAFQERKNSPKLGGPSTQQIQAAENKRPTKRVNCSSNTNKTLAILSGITGGTLECTKMDDHKRFIDAKVNKPPKDEKRN